MTIGAAPSATQPGGLSQDGNTVTVSTGRRRRGAHAPAGRLDHDLRRRATPGYNGTFTVDTRPDVACVHVRQPDVTGLPRTGGGTITLNAPGLTEVGNTVTVRTTLAHNRSVGDQVTIGGAEQRGLQPGDAGHDHRRSDVRGASSSRTPSPGLPNAGAGTVTYTSPFRLSFGGNDSVLIGQRRAPVLEREPDDRDQRHRRLPRHRHGHRRGLDRLHGHVHRRLGRRGRLAALVHRPRLRRVLRLDRGDEPRRRDRLVHDQLRRQRVGPDRERHELHRRPGSWPRSRRSCPPAPRSPCRASAAAGSTTRASS